MGVQEVPIYDDGRNEAIALDNLIVYSPGMPLHSTTLGTVSANKFLTCEHVRTWRQVLLESARTVLSVHCFGRQSLVLLEVCLTVTSASNAILVFGGRL